MQTIILCGGLGTRLKEETEFRPKPMVNIGTQPVLWHIMKIYAMQGLTDFTLALGYKGDMIKEYFFNYEYLNNDFTIELGSRKTTIHHVHKEDGWKITLADTGEKTLKGGRLKRVEKYITDDNFCLTYGDGLCDVDLTKLQAFHKKHGKIATITGVSIASRFGELKIDGDKVTQFSEKPETAPGFINGGYMILNRKIFNYLSESESCDLEFGTFEKLAAEGQLMVYKHPGSWACMDTLRDVDYLNNLWHTGRAFWKKW
ncbi:MAG: glucose-1-phosphate cytidylyltransferase [Candidatus Raymondbacteria bacterium RifOxyA12_full_50_37]|nr:MAG: glucose-1-phosphate cytidylyltransferase [Candidatus Raymondbacteria bacterium RifOxyA12_full_50_37]OGJ88518.1 MAG: glucose-1-phosphate cytidylyltransferase [Candidatus Raymondbacteria bacterium RIFOXYA2_FULL_49_16]OGJ98979.1 MAG: glucose-1-phosphate cytidylyltransferase [Candidatus Raymondbacteria bacterium RIFOXYC2_FULL_50_21]OGK00616.1 MAG: glucose-1-phosphate cytidylyltransferase [Candidatus Raymondbacteria bacterium RifOxyC12_full_50_8]OGP41489.1 MAG: glucose-1-phosphate cytidylylt